MKKGIVFLFLFLFFITSLKASPRDLILLNIKKTNNFSFDFKQSIDDKIEEGNCVIKYPKKIYCSYNNKNKKIIVSNGKSLVIKNNNINQYYIYPLNKTPLELILDKNYLIKEIKNLDGRLIDNKYYNFTIIKNESIINVFFDKKNYNLIGWQTEDPYQNMVITFISSVKKNIIIDSKKFLLPKKN